jgi:hypothetical protein
LDGEAILGFWQKAINGLADGLKLLRSECGVMLPKWLPYTTMLVPLAAMMAKVQEFSGPKVGSVRSCVERWFWCSTFGQAYENSPNSQASKDFSEMLVWFGGGEIPSTVSGYSFDIEELRKTTARQRAIYRGVICVILSQPCRDFHTRKQITVEMLKDSYAGIDDHHVFPGQYLDDTKHPKAGDKDIVLNRTLIDASTNRRIGKLAPSDYLAEIAAEMGEDQLEGILASHALPAKKNDSLRQDDFERFLSDRIQRLKPLIERATKGHNE